MELIGCGGNFAILYPEVYRFQTRAPPAQCLQIAHHCLHILSAVLFTSHPRNRCCGLSSWHRWITKPPTNSDRLYCSEEGPVEMKGQMKLLIEELCLFHQITELIKCTLFRGLISNCLYFICYMLQPSGALSRSFK
jgi:hypothetical protein